MSENLLTKYLKKLGLSEYRELTELERATFKEWEAVLAKDVRIENVAEFLERQIKRQNRELREAVQDGDQDRALVLSAKIDNYETIVLFIREPLEAKKRLEAQLLENLN